MNAYLLYREKEQSAEGRYFEEKNIIRDLGLETVFWAASRDVIREGEKVIALGEPDPFLESAMRKVMMVPLMNAGEISYRQEILWDCFAEEAFIEELYRFSTEVLTCWDSLGRKAGDKAGSRNTPGALITDIHVLHLFVTSLTRLKKLFAEYRDRLRAEGFRALHARLCEEFSEELSCSLERILREIAFYARDLEEGVTGKMVNKPRIVLGCSLADGLKMADFRLEEVDTEIKKYRNPASMFSRAQNYLSGKTKILASIPRGTAQAAQAEQLEFAAVRYIVSCCEPFLNAFNGFFVQLRLQAAFYRGALNLKHHMERMDIGFCRPGAGEQDVLRFRELKEFVMGIEQRRNPVGNSCCLDGKNLLIVTGANQGGKSTFLRSVGLAQICFQCGLQVAAESFESGIFPAFFTHFTRREDSAMNSGRLDEELGRMSRIVDNLGGRSMVLLNESFASTTEKEGSVIAYDIVKALKEAGVKVLTVTHLLSFAQRMYDEREEDSDVEFLSAQRMEDGRRTFRMTLHAPELTSFGLDLYEEIIGTQFSG